MSDATLDDLYRQLLILRKSRIAHGAISGDTVLIDPATQRVTLGDFRNSLSNASPDQLHRDMAGAIAASALAASAAGRPTPQPGPWMRTSWRAPSSICTARHSIPS